MYPSRTALRGIRKKAKQLEQWITNYDARVGSDRSEALSSVRENFEEQSKRIEKLKNQDGKGAAK